MATMSPPPWGDAGKAFVNRYKAASDDICECGKCTPTTLHWSDCAVHNLPAEPQGECTCDPVILNDVGD